MGLITNNFKPSEFQCHCGCGLNNIQLELIDMLQSFADRCNSKVKINRACSCQTHNNDLNSNDNSMHRIGIAADVQTINCSHEFAIEVAIKMYNEGLIGGIIIYKTFLHLDIRRKKYLEDKR